MNKKLLLELAEGLECKATDDNFNLSQWYGEWDEIGKILVGYPIDSWKVEIFVANPNCGTTACALGFTPIIFPNRVKMECGAFVVDGAAFTPLNAGMELFKIEPEEANWIFLPLYYKTDKWPEDRFSVAKRIRVLAENGGIPKHTHWFNHKSTEQLTRDELLEVT